MSCICSISSISTFPAPSSSPKKIPILHCSLPGTVAEHKTTEPLLLNAVRGEDVERSPVWLMSQAGRYMKVMLFSDVFTPLSGMNIRFDIVEKGPVIFNALCTADVVDQVREFLPKKSVPYVGESLTILQKERLKVHNHLLMKDACGFNDSGSVSGFPITPSKLFMQEAIGAEYGEGFETFRQDGPLKVDVDFLNDRLQEGFLHRIRYAMKPDEAYGLVFSWDNVVADTRAMKLNAWQTLASEEGKEIPEDGQVQRKMLYEGADHVLRKVLHWETAENELDRLKLRLSHLYYDHLLTVREPTEGLEEWLDAVARARIPCAVVSSLDRVNMVGILERMGLKKYFQAIVAEEDGMESIAHRFLSAALKLDRKPSKCVVFEDDPRGITAAHNCTMMAVALIGAHPAYELVQADLAVGSFNELSVINLRRLFANKGSRFMDKEKQIIEKSPSKRKLTIDTIF